VRELRITKRQFLALSGSAAIGALLPPRVDARQTPTSSITAGVTPIGVGERKARVAKAQALLREHGMDALLLEAGSTLVYFTGVRWWRSERYTGAIIPREGEIAFVTPHFEEPSVRESMGFGDDVRTWHEHESPFALVAGILSDRGLKDGRIGVEGTVRHFIVDGVQRAAPRFELVSGDAVVRGCRMYKSSAEIALMQAANDVTLAAYRHVYARVEAGMSPGEISRMMNETTTSLGGAPRFALVLLNEASAYPHGTEQRQVVRAGGIVLMDCGCSVYDYESDVSRTWVAGEPSRAQREVWNTVRRGQQLALESATVDTPAGKVDDVVRAFYESKGYGPGYRLPGLSHRVGHGIGMDGHEPVNFVHGEATPLAPGMCFSNEPGIYLDGEFGVRLEDCLYITADGPRLFTELSPSLDRPFG
jgi:Xaa-Pro dipeptidase